MEAFCVCERAMTGRRTCEVSGPQPESVLKETESDNIEGEEVVEIG